jgi:hypothetical protein
MEALAAHHTQLQVWAANCPDNFENRAALVGAEIARLDGCDFDGLMRRRPNGVTPTRGVRLPES